MKRPGRPMFRVVLLLLAWATAGAIVNVAVAWGYSLAHQRYVQETALFPSAPPFPVSFANPRTPALVLRDEKWAAVCDEDRTASRLEQWEERSTRVLRTDFSAGWPALSTYGSIRTGSTGPYAIRPHVLIKRGSTIYCLPVIPIWPGFAVNTVFYAAMLWLLFAMGGTPFALRKRRRIKRGLCPKCAYDLRGRGPNPASDSSVCPECGIDTR